MPGANVSDWVGNSALRIPKGGPSSFMTLPLFVNSSTGVGLSQYPMGVWSTVDLSNHVPIDAVGVRLDGLLIITGGDTYNGICDLAIAFRAKGETVDYAYTMQTITVGIGDGARSVGGTFVPLDSNRCFEVKWTANTALSWPSTAAYGFNLRVTGYLPADPAPAQT
ncbi:Uncharacterised protein [Achromobacter xylosoxidans]|nr:Uncharacterised protein [Achromobacter xylosoxidans]